MIEPPVFFCRSCGCWGDLAPVTIGRCRELVCTPCHCMLVEAFSAYLRKVRR